MLRAAGLVGAAPGLVDGADADAVARDFVHALGMHRHGLRTDTASVPA